MLPQNTVRYRVPGSGLRQQVLHKVECRGKAKVIITTPLILCICKQKKK